jgi:uncharacterized protein YjiS (DUF1127 family)
MPANSFPVWTVFAVRWLRLSLIVARVRTWRTRSRSRAGLRDLDERLLKDIGVSACDRTLETSKWFWQA